jgi:hypothetical protein
MGHFGPRKITIGAKVWDFSGSKIHSVGAKKVIAPVETVFSIFKAPFSETTHRQHTMPDTGSASCESSEGTAYPLRSRGEPVADESRMTDPLAAILKELRLIKK